MDRVRSSPYLWRMVTEAEDLFRLCCRADYLVLLPQPISLADHPSVTELKSHILRNTAQSGVFSTLNGELVAMKGMQLLTLEVRRCSRPQTSQLNREQEL